MPSTILDEILIKSKKSKQNGTAPEIFDICFGVIVDHYKVYFWKRDSTSLYTWSLYTWFIKILKLFGNSSGKNCFTCSIQTNTKMMQTSKILCAELQILNITQARINKLCSFNKKDKKYSRP